MKLFFDTEFTVLTQQSTLISLAIVDENDRTFYAEFTDFDQTQISPWLEDHVLANLMIDEMGEQVKGDSIWIKGDKTYITNRLVNWLDTYKKEGCQFVADVLMYDWVLFADLFGGGLNLPKYVDYMPLDFASLLYAQGLPMHTPRIELLDATEAHLLQQKSPSNSQHNALYDALLLKFCFEKLHPKAA